MNDRKLIKKTDIIIICAIIAIASLCLLLTRGDTAGDVGCQVIFNGKAVKTVSLGEDSTFHIDEASQMEFQVTGSRIAVTHSDCPDKVCVKSGFIGQAGQKIVCLPNKVVVSIDAASGGIDEPDVIAQ